MVNPGHLVRGGTELTTMEVFSKDSLFILCIILKRYQFSISMNIIFS